MMTQVLKSPWFNAQHLPAEREDAYVAWLDVMGARAAMLRSLPVAANFVFKLHVTILEEGSAGVRLYPVMDGAYIAASTQTELRSFLSKVFTRLAYCFNSELQQEHRFLVRSAVAFGPVIHGCDVNAAASNIFQHSDAHAAYKNSILIGMPVVYAAQGESLAPPFGVFVHPSANNFLEPSERKRSYVWWPWFPLNNSHEAQSLRAQLPSYFDWCEARAGLLDYDTSRIREHRARSTQYLVDA